MAARRVKKPKSRAASQALDQLVTQFSDPLAFLRELVQNSLDASTELIEVDVFYDTEASCCVVRVRDTGVGMDRATIDTKLTRLFSSSKEDDLTKIGKFGIGFVSIFAVNPQLVVLETGKDGESWRLLFSPDRSFQRRQLEHPVEGTTVSVFTNFGQPELAKLQEDCRRTVSYWCRHSEVEILFNGHRVNEPFTLPQAPVWVHHQIEGTDVVVAPSVDQKGFHGYYNRGLTLLEGEGSPLPHVSFKLRSRYLEHTLTRDNILHDEGYERALEEVKVAAYQMLPQKMVEALEREPSPRLWDLARAVGTYPGNAEWILRGAKIFPTIGGASAFTQLNPGLYYHPERDDFSVAATRAGYPVLLAEDGRDSAMLSLLADWGKRAQRLHAALVHLRYPDQMDPLDNEILGAIAGCGPRLAPLKGVEILSAPSAEKDRFCLRVPSGETVTASSPIVSEGDEIAIALAHPLWRTLRQLYPRQAELALSVARRKISLELQSGTANDRAVFERLFRSIRSKAVSP